MRKNNNQRKGKPLQLAMLLSALTMMVMASPSRVFAGFGISPVDITNEHMKPGAHYEKVITISRSDSNAKLAVDVETDMEDSKANDWFSYDPGTEFTIDAGVQSFDLVVMIDVPKDADLDDYTGVVRVTTTPEESDGTVAISQGGRVDVNLGVVDEDYVQFNVRMMELEDSYQGEKLPLLIKIENLGNIDAAPTKAVLNVEDAQGNFIVKLETTDIGKVAYGKTEEVYAYFDHDLEPGSYFSNTQVYDGDEQLSDAFLSFDIYEGDRPSSESSGNESNELESMNTWYVLLVVVLVGITVGIIVLFLVVSKKDDSDKTEKKEVRTASKK
ncbi:hypothetical protein JW887_03445 [Candidatus Dojkabacteria bacterium]|nr:hypothetical protein [Candidatus Dojkabacteria bacterium]